MAAVELGSRALLRHQPLQEEDEENDEERVSGPTTTSSTTRSSSSPSFSLATLLPTTRALRASVILFVLVLLVVTMFESGRSGGASLAKRLGVLEHIEGMMSLVSTSDGEMRDTGRDKWTRVEKMQDEEEEEQEESTQRSEEGETRSYDIDDKEEEEEGGRDNETDDDDENHAHDENHETQQNEVMPDEGREKKGDHEQQEQQHEQQEQQQPSDVTGPFVSTGKLEVFSGGDLEDKEVLKELGRVRSFKKEIVIIMVNEGGEKSALNAILNLRRVGIDHYILLVQNEEHCRRLREGPHKVSCAWTSFLSNDTRLEKWRVPVKHCTHCPVPMDLWWGRLKYMGELAELGYNVLYIDTDVFALSNPYVYLHSPALQKHSIIIQREFIHVYGLNIGFIYLNACSPDGPCRWIFREALARLDRLLSVDDVQSVWNESDVLGITSPPHDTTPAGIFGPKAVVWDQNIMNDVIETAVVNKVSHRRSYQRGIKESERRDWIRFLDLPDIPWLRDDDGVYYQKLYNNVHGVGDGTESNETLAGAPPSLLGGWDGIYGPSQVRGVSGWWFTDPPAVIHFVGSSGDKGPPTKLHHMWRAEAECEKNEIMQGTCAFTERKFIGFDAKLNLTADTVHDALSLSDAYRRAMESMLHIASATGRTPIFPLIPCSIAQTVTKSLARSADDYFWHGVLQRNTLMWPFSTLSERYSAETLRDDGMNITIGRELKASSVKGPDFGRHMDASESSLCCTPWVSRAVRGPGGAGDVGNCADAFVYDFELDIIQEAYDMLAHEVSTNGTKVLTIDHVTLEREDVGNKAQLRSKVGADVAAQVIFLKNIDSLFWDEFAALSDADELATWTSRKSSCRIRPENQKT